MNGLDRALRAVGLTVIGSALTWMIFFGIFFLIDIARHQQAHLTVKHGVSWIFIPILLTVAIAFFSILSSAFMEN